MSTKLVSVLSGLLLTGCSVVGVRAGTEEPKYQVVASVGSIEIRQYGPRIAAETIVPGDEREALSAGFRRIAGYIFGANTTSAKIAMTAPVAQSSETPSSESIAMTAPVAQARDASGQWVVRFFMPAQYTLATLPVPRDASVHLVEVQPSTMAVLRFSGFAGEAAIAAHRKTLLAALQASPWQADGTPVAWFYDPPWTIPFLRRNEVAVPVTPRG